MSPIGYLDPMPGFSSDSPFGAPRIIDIENSEDIANCEEIGVIAVPDLVVTVLYNHSREILKKFQDKGRNLQFYRGNDVTLIKARSLESPLQPRTFKVTINASCPSLSRTLLQTAAMQRVRAKKSMVARMSMA